MKKFEATFDSLYQHEYPDWFRDAKFGIWSHWGPQSVPMCGDWYARNMYVQGTPQYLYHIRHYGHPSKFGYKDICALWKAEKFEPERLMEKYVKAGARYFVAQAVHHDHFFNFDSALNPMNSVRVGPGKDIVGLWKAAAEKYNLPFGVTEHLGASFSWWRVNKGCDAYGPYKGVPYDGNDPAWRHFYHDNYEYAGHINDWPLQPWYTANKQFHDYWKRCMFELIDKYTPDLLEGNPDKNVTFHGQVLEAKRFYNMMEHPDLTRHEIVAAFHGAENRLKKNGRLLEGVYFTRQERREFMSRYAKGNRAVAEEYLGTVILFDLMDLVGEDEQSSFTTEQITEVFSCMVDHLMVEEKELRYEAWKRHPVKRVRARMELIRDHFRRDHRGKH